MRADLDCNLIVRVLGNGFEEEDETVLRHRQFISNRYSELKRHLDFQSSAEKARTEWLIDYLHGRV